MYGKVLHHITNFYETHFGQPKKKNVIYEKHITPKSIIGLLMSFLEQYLAVFFTVAKHGHSSKTTKQIFLRSVDDEHLYHFGERRFPQTSLQKLVLLNRQIVWF